MAASILDRTLDPQEISQHNSESCAIPATFEILSIGESRFVEASEDVCCSYTTSIEEDREHMVQRVYTLELLPSRKLYLSEDLENATRSLRLMSGTFGVSLPLMEKIKAWNVGRFSSYLSDSRFSMSGEIAHVSKWPVPGHLTTIRGCGEVGEFQSKAVDCVGLLEFQELLPDIQLVDCEARVAPLPPTALSRLELLTVDLLFESEKFRRFESQPDVGLDDSLDYVISRCWPNWPKLFNSFLDVLRVCKLFRFRERVKLTERRRRPMCPPASSRVAKLLIACLLVVALSDTFLSQVAGNALIDKLVPSYGRVCRVECLFFILARHKWEYRIGILPILKFLLGGQVEHAPSFYFFNFIDLDRKSVV